MVGGGCEFWILMDLWFFITSRVKIPHEVLFFQFLSTKPKIISSFSIRINIIMCYNNCKFIAKSHFNHRLNTRKSTS